MSSFCQVSNKEIISDIYFFFEILLIEMKFKNNSTKTKQVVLTSSLIII